MAEMAHLLEKLDNKREPAFYVILTGKGTKLDTRFIPPLDFRSSCSYEIALASLETYYSFPNISSSNCHLKITLYTQTLDINLHTGCYELLDISKEIQRLVILAGGKKSDFELEPNMNTFQSIMTLGEGVTVDFTGENSLRSILGFEAKVYTNKRNVSKYTVNIMRINSILLHCNIITGSYLNGSEEPVLFSFFPEALPAEKIIIHPSQLIYLPVSMNQIHSLSCWLTDQDCKKIDNRDEILTVKLHIRPC